jgi:hypothetical protein
MYRTKSSGRNSNPQRLKKRSTAIVSNIASTTARTPTNSKSSRTSKKKAIATTPANRSAHQIQYRSSLTLVIKAWFVSSKPYVTKVPAPTWYKGVLMSTLLHVSILQLTIFFSHSYITFAECIDADCK